LCEKYVEVWVHSWVKPACLSIYMHRPSLATKPPPHLRSPHFVLMWEKARAVSVAGVGWTADMRPPAGFAVAVVAVIADRAAAELAAAGPAVAGPAVAGPAAAGPSLSSGAC
jgi:hypothetical protein